MTLKPQDVLVAVKIALWQEQRWSYQTLADSLFLSVSETFAGAKRAEAARLVDLERKGVFQGALSEF